MLSFASFLPCIQRHGDGVPVSKVCNHRSRVDRNRNNVTCIATSFADAVAKRYLFDFGRFVQLDGRGLAFPSNDLHIPDEHRPSLDLITQRILKLVDKDTTVRAIFVRGSLVTGNFLRHECQSDIDLIVFIDKKLSSQKQKAIRNGISGLPLASIIDLSIETDVRQHHKSLLRHYSVPIYSSSLEQLGIPTGLSSPFMDLSKDIREQERRFNVTLAEAVSYDDVHLQRVALQWICKQCLRAVADQCARKACLHCRDLVPAFKIASKQFPQFSFVFLNVLQIACANESNSYAGLGSPKALIDFGLHVVPDAVEIVEHIFLQTTFGSHADQAKRDVIRPQLSPSNVSARPSLVSSISNFVKRIRNRYIPNGSPHLDELDKRPFVRHRLPQISFLPSAFGSTYGITKSVSQGEMTSLVDMLDHFPQPVLVRNAAQICNVDIGTTDSVLDQLLKQDHLVDCRVSPSNIVTFCRSVHPYLDDKSYTAPSVVRRLRVRQAVKRMRSPCALEPLVYKQHCPREHIYIQTQLTDSPSGVANLFERDAQNGIKLDVAQNERLWISTHGTVSSLHYDASHSVLLQRTGTKRMILFPKDALNSLGIYPFGHPLHRRAIVNLSRPSSPLFQDFWTTWIHTAEAVTLGPGDVLIFPPFWAHYTESKTESDAELSISHTFRYW